MPYSSWLLRCAASETGLRTYFELVLMGTYKNDYQGGDFKALQFGSKIRSNSQLEGDKIEVVLSYCQWFEKWRQYNRYLR